MTPYGLGKLIGRTHLKQADTRMTRQLVYQQGSDGKWYIRVMHSYNPDTGEYAGISTLAPKGEKLPEFTGKAYLNLPSDSTLAHPNVKAESK